MMTQPFYQNHLTGGHLHTDARGRVRFGQDGMRFEVTPTGYVNFYRRAAGGEYGRPFIDQRFLGNVDFLRTLANAIQLAKDTAASRAFDRELAGV